MTWKDTLKTYFDGDNVGRYMFVISSKELDEQDEILFSDNPAEYAGIAVLEVYDRQADFETQFSMPRSKS